MALARPGSPTGVTGDADARPSVVEGGERMDHGTTGKDNVIVMRFIEDGPKDRVVRLLKNPIKLERYMRECPIDNYYILDFKPNPIKCHLVISFVHSFDISELYSWDTFGPSEDLFSVECRAPIGGRSVGVLGPIDEDIAVWEIKDYFKETGVNFVDIERMWKGKKEDGKVSKCIKITFEGKEMPDSIKFGYRYLEVRPYFPKVIQCFKCQGFGHRVDDCVSKEETCVKCSGRHMAKDCKENIQKHELKCSNCKENHVASYRGCRVAREAQEIQVIKTLDKVPFSTAKERHTEWKKDIGVMHEVVDGSDVSDKRGGEGGPRPTSSYETKSIVDFRKSYAGRVKYGKMVHKSCQTDDVELKKILDVNTNGDQILKICSFIVTVQRILSDRDNINKLDMLKESINTSLGITVSEEVVKHLFLDVIDGVHKQGKRINDSTNNGR